MKKYLLAALLGATSTFAFAADLPSRRAPPVYAPPPVPVFTWTGFYAGVNAGYTFDNYTSYGVFGPAAGFARTSAKGFTGGGQIGYNYQFGNTPILPLFGNTGGIVVGVEADAAYTDAKSTLFTGAAAFASRTDYIGTARGRVGYAFGDLLVFGTGGFAYGGVRDGIVTAAGAIGATNSIRTGYAYGGGVEYAIPTTSFINFFNSSAVTLKAEFIHYDLGTQSFALGATGGAGIKTTGNLARGGINYKFDLFGTPAPVVARY